MFIKSRHFYEGDRHKLYKSHYVIMSLRHSAKQRILEVGAFPDKYRS